MNNYFSSLIKNSFHKTFLWGLSFAVLCLLSLYVFFNVGLEFDGAFHTQCAINLFKNGNYTLNYGDFTHIQTKLPFQLINGFFLMICGINYSAANLANIVFYIFLWLLVRKLFAKYDTSLLFISFLAISFNTWTLKLAFQGFGEMPSLVFALWGLYYSSFYQKSDKHLFFSGVLIGTAIATKWVLVLVLAPFSLVIIQFLFSRNFRFAGIIIAGFVISLLSFLSIEYYFARPDIGETLTNIASHSSGTSVQYYQSYSERLLKFWDAYVKYAGGDIIIASKFILMVLVAIPSIIIGINFIKQLSKGNSITPEQLFFLQLASFFFVYFFWWFILGSKPWYRRYYNADALLYLSAALCFYLWKDTFKRILYLRYIVPVFMLLSTAVFAVALYPKINKQLYFNKNENSEESKLKSALLKLPVEYTGYGYGWWQAPRWAFFSQRAFKDITALSLEEKNLLLSGSGNHYMFFDSENSSDPNAYRRMHELYELEPVYSNNGFMIKKIISCKGQIDKQLEQTSTSDNEPIIADATRAKLAYVDYRMGDYMESIGLHEREQNRYKWSSKRSSIALTSKDMSRFTALLRIPDIKLYPSEMNITVFFNGESMYTKKITSSGDILVDFPLAEKYKNKSISVSITGSSSFTPANDPRELSFVVSSIGFQK